MLGVQTIAQDGEELEVTFSCDSPGLYRMKFVSEDEMENLEDGWCKCLDGLGFH